MVTSTVHEGRAGFRTPQSVCLLYEVASPLPRALKETKRMVYLSIPAVTDEGITPETIEFSVRAGIEY